MDISSQFDKTLISVKEHLQIKYNQYFVSKFKVIG